MNVASTTSSTGPGVLLDEDDLVLPEELREEVLPRRGGVTGRPITVAEDAVEIIERHEREIRDVMEKMRGDEALSDAGRVFLLGRKTPLGAAVVATVDAQETHHDRGNSTCSPPSG
ncbi:hypothetical protein FHR81_000980 [Actinoalloteichus hoggarensis]|uniref:Uncharacterized protein n=1 Tax=Actinoalloteichus hoggarensis TaxID=1470176 RepID=A0A221VYW9_9PSEU|nr:hypothetical protein [Actinoalloteichus hoggarensis]ASO18717.1 hypothetical protein AHOG_05320 [Actinoalloteichus hoggarensis]MBB5919950.1 hypothetical protein [Actinoalloteichus hoggarensis]